MTESDGKTSESDALRIAQEVCAQHEIPWLEPHTVTRGWRWWRVRTPSDQRGGNAIILVSRKTGIARVRRYSR